MLQDVYLVISLLAAWLTIEFVVARADGVGFNSPDSYRLSSTLDRDDYPIDDPYVDGLSVTYGSPRQHIWTFYC